MSRNPRSICRMALLLAAVTILLRTQLSPWISRFTISLVALPRPRTWMGRRLLATGQSGLIFLMPVPPVGTFVNDRVEILGTQTGLTTGDGNAGDFSDSITNDLYHSFTLNTDGSSVDFGAFLFRLHGN